MSLCLSRTCSPCKTSAFVGTALTRSASACPPPPPQSLGQFQAQGLEPHCLKPGVHDPLDPEFSILKQRLARRVK